MGLFRKKTETKPINETMAQNVFGKTLLNDENIEHSLQGKSGAENLIFSVAVLALTNKRCLYYSQSGSKTETETIMYNKITSTKQINGFEKNMGEYTGISITEPDGKERIIRCKVTEENRNKINNMIFSIESQR